jgi:signal transduction histidine kinase
MPGETISPLVQATFETFARRDRRTSPAESPYFVQGKDCIGDPRKTLSIASATIQVGCRGGNVQVEIRDAGKGISQFDPKKKMPARVGVGVQGMQERVGQLLGKFEIQSETAGTTVSMTLSAQRTQELA